MLKDTEEALRRLEQELLAEEQEDPLDSLVEEFLAEPLEEDSCNYDVPDPEADLYCDEPEDFSPKRSLTGLAIATGVLTAGIVGAVAWWLTRSVS